MEIEFKGVNYKDKLFDINYKFEQGSITSIIGSSGSGKSLLGFVIMGLITNYDGQLIVDGHVKYDKYDFLRNVGYVFQNPWDHFICKTVYEEVLFGLKQFRYKESKQDKQVRDALKMVGLDDSYLDRRLNTLSSGEASRVAIASSIVMNPKVLVLDEPTIYLDYNMKIELIDLLKRLKEKYNKTIIIMSDDMEFVYAVSDNYLLMNKGMIVKRGVISDIRKQDDELAACGIYVPRIDDFVNFVREYKDINLNNVRNIDELVQEVIAHE